MNKAQWQRLETILSQPTAPFREQHVVTTATDMLQQYDVPFFPDSHGNLVVGVSSHKQLGAVLQHRNREPLRLFVAHMDHPGFHGQRWLSARRLAVKWFGGTPVKHLRGSQVWLADSNELRLQGHISNAVLTRSKRSIASAEIVIERGQLPARRPAARNLFGGFAFKRPLWRRGKRLYTRAVDDLYAVSHIVNLAIELNGKYSKSRQPFIGLLTRGEEVGFVGAIEHLRLGWYRRSRRPVVAVSLEASRTLPGALIGKGPIVRLGDWRTVFHADFLQLLTELAQRHMRGQYQRRIMDGGSCEATATTAFGLPTIGLSLPLGNYHNQGLNGGEQCRGEKGPAPEFANIVDIEMMYRLCKALIVSELPWQDPWQRYRQKLERHAAGYRRYL
jgi:endoglucanase